MTKSDFNILVVDDDEIARDVVVNLLTKEGYPVFHEKDGLGAIKKIQSGHYDLIITDLRMPGADGMEVLKTVKKLDNDAAVVILTAYGTLDNALKAVKLGAFDYITKPFKLQEIIIVVENAFKRLGLIRQKEELTGLLRETYRDPTFKKYIANGGSGIHTGPWKKRIRRLREMEILDPEESDTLWMHLTKGNG